MEVLTPWGEYQIDCMGATVVLQSKRDGNGWEEQCLTINGIEFRGAINFKYGIFHVYETRGEPTGKTVKEWRIDGMLYLYRKGTLNPVTDGIRRKVYDQVQPWVDTWLKCHPEEITAGWLRWYESRITLANNHVLEARKVVDAAVIKRLEAEEHLDEYKMLKRNPEPDDICSYITCGHIRQNHDFNLQDGNRYVCNDSSHISTGRCLCMAFEEPNVRPVQS